MKLILRNQLLRSPNSETASVKSSSRTLVALALAGVVTGVNYFFQNFIANQDN